MATFGQEGRRRQGDFRDTSSSISDAARHPTDDKGMRHRHLLALGHEEENLYPALRGPEGARRFFSDRRIPWWRSSRSGDSPGKDAPTRNLASSQLACANFLLPLATIPSALAACLRAIDQDVQGVEPVKHEGRESLVELEWIGLGKSLECGTQRGAQNTSVDAFMVGLLPDGRRRAYLLEWKYVEEYKEGHCLGNGKAGETRRARYRHLYEGEGSSFLGIVPLDDLLYEPIYQIVRLRLLADRMVRDGELGVTEATVIVVCPEGNREYRDRITSPQLAARLPQGAILESAIQSLLKHPEGFRIASPARLVSALRGLPADTELSAWLRYQAERYGW